MMLNYIEAKSICQDVTLNWQITQLIINNSTMPVLESKAK